MSQLQNPYAPPSAPSEPASAPSALRIASRWKRLGGSTVDLIATIAVGSMLARGYAAATSTELSTLSIEAGALVPTMAQWVLIALRGQSLGKLVFKMRICRADGTTASPFHGVALRAGPLFGLQLLITFVRPLKALCNLASMIDILFIFGGDRRCIHDRIADTYVVDV